MILKTFVVTIAAIGAAAQYEIDAFNMLEAQAMAITRFEEKFNVEIVGVTIKEETE